MIRKTLLAAAFATLGTSAFAQGVDIQSTIQGQIDAFKADDFSQAFTFASPMIQGIFGDPNRFGMMVRNGYPMVYRPAQVRFLDQREVAGRIFQKVLIRDVDGRAHILDYQMIQTDKGWQINGVQILQAPEVGA